MDFSSDYRFLATGSVDGAVNVWKCADWEKLTAITQKAPISFVRFAEGGETLLTGSLDGSVRKWNAKTGVAGNESLSMKSSARCIDIAPDQKSFVCGSDDGTVSIWDSNSFLKIREHSFGDIPYSIRHVSFAKDGESVVVRSLNGAVFMWNMVEGDVRQVVPGPIFENEAFCLAASPDGTSIAFNELGHTNEVHYCELSSGAVTKGFRTNSSIPLRALKYSRDGSILAALSVYGRLSLWDTLSNQELTHRFGSGRISAISFAGKTALLACGMEDGSVLIFELHHR